MSKPLTTIPVPPDLLESSGLKVQGDSELQSEEFQAENRHLRLFVAAYMLGTNRSPQNALQTAEWLYANSGMKLTKPGELSQQDIELEVWGLVDRYNEALEKR